MSINTHFYHERYLFLATMALSTLLLNAQNDIDVLLAGGVEDAQRFANDYLAPGTNSLMHSMNANWFNSARTKPLGGFEVSVIANATLVSEEDKVFNFDTSEYNKVRFVQGANAQNVFTALGENVLSIFVEVEYQDIIFGSQTVQLELTEGIGDSAANLVSTAFILGAFGLSNKLELKARFIPEYENQDADFSTKGEVYNSNSLNYFRPINFGQSYSLI